MEAPSERGAIGAMAGRRYATVDVGVARAHVKRLKSGDGRASLSNGGRGCGKSACERTEIALGGMRVHSCMTEEVIPNGPDGN